jgi:hypothetical protein
MVPDVLLSISSADPMVRVPAFIGLGAMAAAVLILCVVLLTQCLILVQQRRRERFRALWNPILTQRLMEIPQGLPALRFGEARLFLESWNYLRESIRGDVIANLDHVMRLVGADRAARRMLRCGRLSDRLNAVIALGHLRDRSVWDQLRRLVASRSPELALAAARALILIDAEAALPILTSFVGSRSDWSFIKVASMLNEAGPELVADVFASATQAATPDVAARLVRCLEATGSPNALAAVRKIIEREDADEELIVACLRCFRRSGGSQELELVRARLSHPNRLIRLHAVMALGKVGTRDDVPRLIERLEDDEWWVRYRAAEALAGFPFVSRDMLSNLQVQHHDQEVRTILASFIAFRGVLR